MSEVITALLERRSIRNFKPDQIKASELETIIKAGQFAPSAANQQSWHFTVVQNPDLLTRISKAIRNIFLQSGNPAYVERAKAENFSPFYHAPTLIIVAGDQKAIAPEPDASLALGNIQLAAHALGVGSVWVHSLRQLFTSEEGQALNQELKIPEGYTIFGSAALGYNAGATPTAPPRKEGTVTTIN